MDAPARGPPVAGRATALGTAPAGGRRRSTDTAALTALRAARRFVLASEAIRSAGDRGERAAGARVGCRAQEGGLLVRPCRGILTDGRRLGRMAGRTHEGRAAPDEKARQAWRIGRSSAPRSAINGQHGSTVRSRSVRLRALRRAHCAALLLTGTSPGQARPGRYPPHPEAQPVCIRSTHCRRGTAAPAPADRPVQPGSSRSAGCCPGAGAPVRSD